MTEKIIKFKSYDGYELKGALLKADKEKGALLFVHGITSSRDELGFHSDYAKFLGQNGIMHNPMMLTTNPVMLTTLYCSPSGQVL